LNVLGEKYLDRFVDRILVSDGCWEWTGGKWNNGYGYLSVSTDTVKNRLVCAHRVSYEFLVGPIDEGLHLDHLCRNPGCVNPQHLEPVTRKVNILRGTSPFAENARKTHCPHGHEYDEANTLIIRRKGKGTLERHCRACGRRRFHERQARLRAA
jgi:hypothetical protein